MAPQYKDANAGSAIGRILVYLLVVLTPLVLAAIFRRETGGPFLSELGKALALVAYAILAMQFVVSARPKWIERPFGLDMVFRFHKAMAVVAAWFLIAHPVLLATGRGSPRLLVSLDLPWYILVGKVALLILVLMALVATFRAAIRLDFEKWRLGHNSAAAVILVLGALHAWYAAEDVRLFPMQLAWIGILALAAVAYVHHRFLAPAKARRDAYEVAEVTPETHNVWTLRLKPLTEHRAEPHWPGQFHFLTLYRSPGLPVEEHPFTISSDPSETASLSFTIKESGDFTSTIPQTRPGDKAALRGPYGRFSYVLQPEVDDLVFIAGGIGVTPFISMLRHMRSTGADKRVLLIYGNRAERDIAFREELTGMEAGDHPRLTVVHVLSEPDEGWQGESGLVDRSRLERLCGPDLAGKTFYVCGPPPMSGGVLRALRDLGAPASRLHHEHFAL
jgi:predicted ferric reductase